MILGGEQGADGGAVDARQPTEAKDGRGHHGSGIAGGVDGAGLAALHQVHGQVDAGVPLAAHRGGLLVHADGGATGHQLQPALGDRRGELFLQSQLGHGLGQPLWFRHEAHLQGQQLHGVQAALQDRAGGVVAAHAIHCHPNSLAVLDGGGLAAMASLQAPQPVDHQGLQHRSGRAGGRASDAAGAGDGGASHGAGAGDRRGGGAHQGGDRRVAAIPNHQPPDGTAGLGAARRATAGFRLLRGQRCRRCVGTDIPYREP